jgi:hypothetical protein
MNARSTNRDAAPSEMKMISRTHEGAPSIGEIVIGTVAGGLPHELTTSSPLASLDGLLGLIFSSKRATLSATMPDGFDGVTLAGSSPTKMNCRLLAIAGPSLRTVTVEVVASPFFVG